MVAAIVEDERGDPFLYNGRATTVLDLVDLGDAAPLAAEELAQHRRPAEHRHEPGVENVVEAIAVIIMCIVRQFGADLLLFEIGPYDDLAPVGALLESQGEAVGK